MDEIAVGSGSLCFSNIVWPLSAGKSLAIAQGNLKFKQLTASPDAFFATVQTEAELEIFITAQSLFEIVAKEIEDRGTLLNLNLNDGAIEIEAEFMVAFAKVKGNLKCRLQIIEAKTLNVDLIDARLLGVGATTLAKSFISSINPIFDVSAFPYPSRIEKADIVDGNLLIKISVSPNNSKSSSA